MCSSHELLLLSHSSFACACGCLALTGLPSGETYGGFQYERLRSNATRGGYACASSPSGRRRSLHALAAPWPARGAVATRFFGLDTVLLWARAPLPLFHMCLISVVEKKLNPPVLAGRCLAARACSYLCERSACARALSISRTEQQLRRERGRELFLFFPKHFSPALSRPRRGSPAPLLCRLPRLPRWPRAVAHNRRRLTGAPAWASAPPVCR